MFGETLDYRLLRPFCRHVSDPYETISPEPTERDLANAATRARTFRSYFGAALDLDGKDVLDVGCGRGLTTLALSELGPRSVTGVDYHGPSIDQAHQFRDRWPQEAGRRVEFVHADFLGWRTDRRFDVVLSVAAFEHFPRPREALFAMANLLRPGGVVATQFGPLFHSMYGDHMKFFRLPIPWRGVLFNHRALFRLCREFFWTKSTVDEIASDYNLLRYGEFVRDCRDTGLEIVLLRPNVTPANRRPRALWAAASIASDLLGRIPLVRDLISHAPIVVLRKPLER